jgi:hypothetical protein
VLPPCTSLSPIQVLKSEAEAARIEARNELNCIAIGMRKAEEALRLERSSKMRLEAELYTVTNRASASSVGSLVPTEEGHKRQKIGARPKHTRLYLDILRSQFLSRPHPLSTR